MRNTIDGKPGVAATPLGYDCRPSRSGPSRFETLSFLRIDMLAVLRRGQVYRACEIFQFLRNHWGHVHERRLWRCLAYLCRMGLTEHVRDGAAVPRHADSVYRVTRFGRLVRERLLRVGESSGLEVVALRVFPRQGASRRFCPDAGRRMYLIADSAVTGLLLNRGD